MSDNLAQENGLLCHDGRTPREEWLYRVGNRLSLREELPTDEEMQGMMDRIFEEYETTFRLLADA